MKLNLCTPSLLPRLNDLPGQTNTGRSRSNEEKKGKSTTIPQKKQTNKKKDTSKFTRRRQPLYKQTRRAEEFHKGTQQSSVRGWHRWSALKGRLRSGLRSEVGSCLRLSGWRKKGYNRVNITAYFHLPQQRARTVGRGCFAHRKGLFTRLRQKCFTYQRATVALSELLIILRSSETARPCIGFPPRQI